MQFPNHPLWQFSLEIYGREGVATACLALQDRRGADVNLLLACCWWAAIGRGRLEPSEIAALIGAASDWRREVVAPLRRARRWLKQAPDPALTQPFRNQVKALELDAEHLEQLLVAAALPAPRAASVKDDPAQAAMDNLVAYLAAEGIAPDAADRAALGILVREGLTAAAGSGSYRSDS